MPDNGVRLRRCRGRVGFGIETGVAGMSRKGSWLKPPARDIPGVGPDLVSGPSGKPSWKGTACRRAAALQRSGKSQAMFITRPTRQTIQHAKSAIREKRKPGRRRVGLARRGGDNAPYLRKRKAPRLCGRGAGRTKGTTRWACPPWREQRAPPRTGYFFFAAFRSATAACAAARRATGTRNGLHET